MVDSISIYYFSGTGNTEKVALTFYKHLRKEVSVCSVYRMEDHIHGNKRPVLQNSVVGLLFPVYFHSIPRLVEDFIQNASFAPYTKVFLIAVSSNISYADRTSLFRAAHLVRKKQSDIYFHEIVPMPRNIQVKQPAAVSAKLHNIAVKRTPEITKEIIHLNRKHLSFSVFHFLLDLLSSKKTFGKRFGKNLTVSSKCIKCGLCIRNCPTKNIRMDIGIKFGYNCTMCMRCIYYCPVNAIRPGWLKSLPVPGGYDLEVSINSPFAKNESGEYKKTISKGLIKYIDSYNKNL